MKESGSKFKYRQRSIDRSARGSSSQVIGLKIGTLSLLTSFTRSNIFSPNLT